MRSLFLNVFGKIYRSVRPLLFLIDSEKIHGYLTSFGEFLGSGKIAKRSLGGVYRVRNTALEQTFHGIRFENPVGLAAGFDYEARLTQILPAIGFGFGTVGTITNKPYEGNPPPILGRLIKSRSLMVNKGFKNSGIRRVLQKLTSSNFDIPIGLSIGKTNTRDPMSQEDAVQDVVAAFRSAESASVPFSYYELNISCPNLYGDVEFYSPARLYALLAGVTGLKLAKPLFIKMPIERSDEETEEMLKVIVSFPVQGVIFGNLQKNRNDPALDPREVKKYSSGYFSGKPTEKRSNELIRLAYKHFGQNLTIVGCGGIFEAKDAYRKIKLGASLVQLITGLIYVGPQLTAQINLGLVKLLHQDGFRHVSQAIGAGV